MAAPNLVITSTGVMHHLHPSREITANHQCDATYVEVKSTHATMSQVVRLCVRCCVSGQYSSSYQSPSLPVLKSSRISSWVFMGSFIILVIVLPTCILNGEKSVILPCSRKARVVLSLSSTEVGYSQTGSDSTIRLRLSPCQPSVTCIRSLTVERLSASQTLGNVKHRPLKDRIRFL